MRWMPEGRKGWIVATITFLLGVLMMVRRVHENDWYFAMLLGIGLTILASQFAIATLRFLKTRRIKTRI